MTLSHAPRYLLLTSAVLLLTCAASAQETDLTTVSLTDLSSFRSDGDNWTTAGGVFADRDSERTLDITPGTGILVNTETENGVGSNLFTTWEHGDLELELDFLMPSGSNSGIYLQGRYEIQVFDSWGVAEPSYSDAGGIYERWDDTRPEGERGYEGHPPGVNVSRAPGLWQHFRIIFQAPRFDADGQKTANARFLEVWHNGVLIHEDVEVTGPTRAAAFEDEQPMGPLMLQGDHGPVAYRNIRYKRYIEPRVQTRNTRYAYYEGEFDGVPDVGALTPRSEGGTDSLTWGLVEARDNFALTFDGELDIPETDTYTFKLALVGAGTLSIDGRPLIAFEGQNWEDEKGNPPEKTDTVRLQAGLHPFSLQYFKQGRNWARPRLFLHVQSPVMPWHELTTPPAAYAGQAPQPIPVEVKDEPYLFRGFIEFGDRKRTHAIAVGEPDHLHYAYDLNLGAMLYIWKGTFLDARPMWEARGEAQTPLPSGSVIPLSGKPTVVGSDPTTWPDTLTAEQFDFGGYTVDEAGRPTFLYTVEGIMVEDHLEPDAENRYLTRTLTLDGNDSVSDAWCLLAEGKSIERLPNGSYGVDDGLYLIELHETAGAEPSMRSQDGRMQLVLPVDLAESKTVSYNIVW